MSDSGDSSSRAGRRSLGGRLRTWLGAFGRNGDESLREDLQELLEDHAEDGPGLGSEEQTLLRNILNVSDLAVVDVMVPRADIVALPGNATLQEAVRQFIACGHSRLPLFRETLDDTPGFLHVKDLLPFWSGDQHVELERHVRKLLFVPPSVPVLDLLLQMRRAGVHIALVVDEYGAVDGLVTIEDLVEQIVGEIRDEYDKDEATPILERPDGTLEVDARCPVDDLEARLARTLLPPDLEEEVDTLGGLVLTLAGRVPRRGTVVVHPTGLEFEVLDADTRRVKRLRIRNLAALQAPPDAVEQG
jgi:magnesium and cobalt transporter